MTSGTLAQLVLQLRDLLGQARKDDNQVELVRLQTTFGLLAEMSYGLQNSPLTTILIALEDAARDAAMGITMTPLPSADEIKNLE